MLWRSAHHFPTALSTTSIAFMTDIAAVLKSEITRLSRKEIRKETVALKKAVNSQKAEIAELKRGLHALDQRLKRIDQPNIKAEPVALADPIANTRFSAKGLASLRRRLSLSAEQCGQLIGASAQSVYNWEQGKAKPRAQYLSAISELRGLGTRQVAARLNPAKA